MADPVPVETIERLCAAWAEILTAQMGTRIVVRPYAEDVKAETQGRMRNTDWRRYAQSRPQARQS